MWDISSCRYLQGEMPKVSSNGLVKAGGFRCSWDPAQGSVICGFPQDKMGFPSCWGREHFLMGIFPTEAGHLVDERLPWVGIERSALGGII